MLSSAHQLDVLAQAYVGIGKRQKAEGGVSALAGVGG